MNKKNVENPEEFYARLRSSLLESATWPAPYLYKFIVASDPVKIKEVAEVFKDKDAVFTHQLSKNGKYTSISIRVTLDNPDAVIDLYKEVGAIDGVISL